MGYLLNVSYLALIVVASPWLIWSAVRRGKYREGLAEKILGRAPRRDGDRRCAWFHAVSAGEASLLVPLIARFRQQHPDWDCVVSVTTKNGREMAAKKYPDLTVFYCPLDFTWAVKNALARVQPDLLVLSELELWPNLIHVAKRHGVKLAIVNGRLSEHSARGYRRIRPIIKPLLERLDVIAAQTDCYAERFRDLGARPESTHVTGSMKFDGAETNRNNSKTRELAGLAGIQDSDVVFLAGSTQEPEEALAIQTYQHLRDAHPELRLIIAPRHLHRVGEITKMLDDSGVSWQRRSELDEVGSRTESRVLFVDTIGELAAWWGTARIAYVGGSMGKRNGQNMIEPAAYGAAVSFGPKTKNFRDVVRLLLDQDAAVVVDDGVALTAFVERCLSDPSWSQDLGDRAKAVVSSQLGATERTMALLSRMIEPRHRQAA